MRIKLWIVSIKLLRTEVLANIVARKFRLVLVNEK